jgi:hypothetical protein
MECTFAKFACIYATRHPGLRGVLNERQDQTESEANMISRFFSIVLCVLLVLGGCDGGAEPASSGQPDAGPDEEPPVWAEYAELKASNLGPDHVQLTWALGDDQIVTDDVGVTTFVVYQDEVVVGKVDIDDSWSFQPVGLQPDTVYLFQVQAADAAGNWSTDGPSREVKTECPTYWEDKCPVSWPPDAVLMAEPTGDTSVRLTWTPAYDNQEVRWYRVLQDGECICQDFGVPESNHTVEGDVTEYEVTGLQAGQVYHFQVSARDSVGIEHGGGGWILGPEVEVSL